jgi:aminoglycoside phosphotransferase (APT) family kinase protein
MHIRKFNNYKVIKPILKGWSDDEKFYMEDDNGAKFLLRLSDISLYDKRLEEFESLKQLSELGLSISNPIEFGTLNDNKKVYSILTWIDGVDALDVVPKLSESRQYELGYNAGLILQKIQSLKPTKPIQPWNKTIGIKIKKTIEFYNNCGFKIKNDSIIIDYILSHERFLKDRPITFQHGDYHLGNMIISNESNLSIIDFNRFSFGDPWEEFDRLIFTWKESVFFARGQIDGYFNNDVPEEFFKILSIYNARNLIASIPWSLSYSDQDLEIAIVNAKLVYDSYDGFNSYIPKWYKG